MKYDTSGEGVGKYLTINGPTETYQIKEAQMAMSDIK